MIVPSAANEVGIGMRFRAGVACIEVVPLAVREYLALYIGFLRGVLYVREKSRQRIVVAHGESDEDGPTKAQVTRINNRNPERCLAGIKPALHQGGPLSWMRSSF